MGKLDGAFLEKLLAAFAAEAAERLGSVNRSLAALEALPREERRALASDEAKALVETVFRETHSLKGAARAVNQSDVELLCQRMESVFAALKAGRLALGDDLLDDLHAASTEIGRLLAAGAGQDVSASAALGLAARLDRRIGERTGGRPDDLPEIRPAGRPAARPVDQTEARPAGRPSVPEDASPGEGAAVRERSEAGESGPSAFGARAGETGDAFAASGRDLSASGERTPAAGAASPEPISGERLPLEPSGPALPGMSERPGRPEQPSQPGQPGQPDLSDPPDLSNPANLANPPGLPNPEDAASASAKPYGERSAGLVKEGPAEGLEPPASASAPHAPQASVPPAQPAGKTAEARPAPAAPPEGALLRVEASRLEELLMRAEEMLASKSGLERRAAAVAELAAETRGLWGALQEAMAELPGLRGLIERSAERDGAAGAASSMGGRSERVLSLLEDAAPRLDRLRIRLGQVALEAERGQAALSGQVDALLDGLKDVLMLPLSSLFEAMPKIARDLSRSLGKSLRLETAGGDVRLDRRILDELRDPLIHLIRNAADHGVETPEARRAAGKPEQGRIVLRAARMDRNKVEIVLEDDGAGLDPARIREAAARRGLIAASEAAAMSDEEAVRLIFRSEVSTSPIITDISGRGLGLAIVAEKIERLGGAVSVGGEPGRGVVFSLALPVTVSSFRGLVAECAGRVLVVAKAAVERALLVEPERLSLLQGRDVLFLGDRPVSVSPLADLLEFSAPSGQAPAERAPGPLTVLVLRAGSRRAGVIVDALLGEEELMVKDLGKQLRRVRNVAGLTLLGNGRLAPILHAPDLVRTAASAAPSRSVRPPDRAPPARKTVLVAEDSITSRTLIANILEAAGYRTLTAVDGRKALEAIQAQRPDLLVSDVQMPIMDGFELTARLREEPATAELPVVLVTSLDSREDRERGVQVGANAYIVKSSFDQSNLLDVIAKLI